MRVWLILAALGLAACKTLPGETTAAAQCQDQICHHMLAHQGAFTGTLVNGKADGHGQYRDTTSSIRYEGNFRAGKFDGNGVLITPSSVFTGVFRDGVPAQGELATPNLKLDITNSYKDRFQAHYELGDGIRGDGEFSYVAAAEHTVGIVAFDQLQRQGEHRIQYPNGDTYTARYSNGVQQGTAVWASADGKQDRVETWDNGKLITSRPGPTTLQQQARSGQCKIDPALGTFAWFGKGCRNGLAEGKGVAYSLDGLRILTGEFRNGQLVQGSDQQGSTLFQGRFRNLKLQGEGQHFLNETLLFSGQYHNGEKGKGLCLVDGNYIPCDHYEGQRIIEEQELSGQHQIDIAREQARAQESARQAYASLNRLRSDADDTFNARDRRWQRDREQEASDRAFNQSMNNAFKKLNDDMTQLAEQNRQFNENLRQQQAQIQAQQPPKRDYYAESLQRIASQQNQQQIANLQQPASTPAPAKPTVDVVAEQENRCKAQGGTFNRSTRDCIINRTSNTASTGSTATTPARTGSTVATSSGSGPSPVSDSASSTTSQSKGYEGCYGPADHRRGRGNCIQVVEEAFKGDCDKGRKFKIRIQNTCDYRVVTNVELKTTRQYHSSAQLTMKPGATASWDTCAATGEWGYEAWFSVKGSSDWLCKGESSWVNEPF